MFRVYIVIGVVHFFATLNDISTTFVNDSFKLTKIICFRPLWYKLYLKYLYGSIPTTLVLIVMVSEVPEL